MAQLASQPTSPPLIPSNRYNYRQAGDDPCRGLDVDECGAELYPARR